MEPTAVEPSALLDRCLESGRIHSAYLISGPADAARELALRFARGIACQGAPRPCDDCPACRRSSPREEIALDGTGKKGPLLRHVGDHADLFWVERGSEDLYLVRGDELLGWLSENLQEGQTADLGEAGIRRWSISRVPLQATLRQAMDTMRNQTVEAVCVYERSSATGNRILHGVMTREDIEKFSLSRL